MTMVTPMITPGVIPETTTVTTIDLSIIIVSWNTRKLLDDCLQSVYSSVQKVSTEVWVIDNASADGSPELVRERYPQAHLIANADNVGFARANNQAIPLSKGRYILLLNSDTVVPDGAWERLVKAMDDNPDVGVCSPLLLNEDGTPQLCWAKFPDLAFELSGNLDRSQSPYAIVDFADARKREQMKPFFVDWVGGACFLIRASLLAKIGLLDESYFMYSEETDWCVRFKKAGHRVMLVPDVTVTHLGGGSSRSVRLKTRERMYRSSLRFYRKTYGAVGSIFPSILTSARYLLFRLVRGREK